MKGYLCLNEQIFTEKDYSICPIRVEDKFLIMRWRNEQIYHLRQSKPLTEEDQIKYFDEVVTNQEQNLNNKSLIELSKKQQKIFD